MGEKHHSLHSPSTLSTWITLFHNTVTNENWRYELP